MTVVGNFEKIFISPGFVLTLIYMGYFNYLFYMGGGAKKPPPV